MSLYEWKKIEWKMTGLSVGKVLEKMERAKEKAIRRAEKYNTMPPRFNRQLERGEDREPASLYRVLEDYIEAVDWEFRKRISEETSQKKQRKLFKNMKAITRPCRVYFSAAAILVTRAIRDMAVHLKKVRGEHWLDIRKKNAHMIEWDLRTWCRARGYTDKDEDEWVRNCHQISDALNGILPEGRNDFKRIAFWFHNKVYPLPHWWWEWWNMENGGLEVNPSVSYRQRVWSWRESLAEEQEEEKWVQLGGEETYWRERGL